MNPPPKLSWSPFKKKQRDAFLEGVTRDKVVLKNKLNAVQLKLSEQQSANERLTKDLQDGQDQLQRLQADLASITTQRDELTERNQWLLKQIERPAEDIQRLTEQVVKLTEAKAELEALHKQVQADNERIQAQLAAAESSPSELEAKLAEVEVRRAELDRLNLELVDENESVRREMEEIKSGQEAALITLREEVASVRAEKESEIAALTARLNEASSQGPELDELRSKAEALVHEQEHAAELLRRIEELEAERSEAEIRNREEIERISREKSEEIDSLHSQIRSIREEKESAISDLQHRIDMVRGEQWAEIERLKAALDGSGHELQRAYDSERNIQGALDGARSEADRLREEINSVKADKGSEIAALHGRINDIERDKNAEIARLNQALAAAETELARVNEDFAKLREEHTELESSQAEVSSGWEDERAQLENQTVDLEKEILTLRLTHEQESLQWAEEKTTLESKAQALDDEAGSLRALVADQDDLAETEKKAADLLLQVDSLVTTIEGYAEARKRLEAETIELRRQLNEEKGQAQALADEMAYREKFMAEEVTRSLGELTQRNKALLQENEKISSIRDSLESEVTRLRSRIAEQEEDGRLSQTAAEKSTRAISETQKALDELRLSSEREQQLIIDAAHHHADEIVTRAQRRINEESWELRHAQVERQRFIENFRSLLKQHLDGIDKLVVSDSLKVEENPAAYDDSANAHDEAKVWDQAKPWEAPFGRTPASGPFPPRSSHG